MTRKTKPKSKKTRATSESENSEQANIDYADIELPTDLPVLAIKDIVAFPSVMMSFYISRDQSLAAVEAAENDNNFILVVAQKDQQIEAPEISDLYKIGVVANIVRVLKLSDDKYKILIQGLTRAHVRKYHPGKKCLFAKVEPVLPEEPVEIEPDVAEIMDRIKHNIQAMVEYQDLQDDLLMVVEEVDDVGMFSDLLLAHLKPEVGYAQSALEEFDPIKRLKIVDALIGEDLNKILVSEQIRDKAESELTKGQREYYLREQLKQIKSELGEVDDTSQDLQELKRNLLEAKLPKHAAEEATKQFKRLEIMNPESSDAALIRTYLEWIIDLPWAKRTRDRVNLKITKEILDCDHYGLDKVKDRILEYLSVRKLNRDSKGPILCLVGPPGVGKTSLGRSIAKSLGRSFFRLSLGGVRDEAEIRGHRRTYVGALPGRILQGMKQAGSKNPVFMLDELDKVGADFRGDPAAALLEVLDPEQNKEFSDHYINVPFDLSDTMFIATANTTDTIPAALLDRLEIIRIPGYTTEEKLSISKKYLVPKQLAENGIRNSNVEFPESGIIYLIEHYTREAGVRNLEREIGSLFRKIAREYAEGRKGKHKLDDELVRKFLGVPKYNPEERTQEDAVGYVTGLAWTIYGGETMPIEISTAKGKGRLTLTGQLGEVMQESAQAALFFARANASSLKVDPEFYENVDIHVHVPEGATPKDGPSAGVAITVGLVSALSERKVSAQFAMTGEVTLRGNVLAVGGLKEKALAALRYGIKKIIIPQENLKDLEDIPKEQRDQIEFVAIKHVIEALDLVLIGESKYKPKSIKSQKRRPKVSIYRTV